MQTHLVRNITLFVVLIGTSFAGNYTVQFDPKASETFDSPSPRQSFTVSYLDGSGIGGFIGIDRVSIGPYNVITQFGGITTSSWNWEGDGILGLGIADDGVTPPLLKTMSGVAPPDAEGGNLLPRPEISLWMTETGGVLGLGGPIEGSHIGNFTYVNVVPDGTGKNAVWQIPMSSMRLGRAVILYNASETTIIDSGSSCIGLKPELFVAFKQALQNAFEKPSLFVTFGGTEFEITWSDFAFDREICVGMTPQTQLGDPFFRAVVTLFNVDPSGVPKIGIAPRNRTQTPRDVAHGMDIATTSHRLPLTRVLQDENRVEVNLTSSRRVRYFTQIAVGSPPQYFTVLIDTGSTCTAIYSIYPYLSQTAVILMIVGGCLLALILAFSITFFVLRRRWLKKNEQYRSVPKEVDNQLEIE